MASVLVRHCTLRVVRHGGWTWGADPRQLFDRLLQRLPQLLAEALARLWPDGEDRHIAAPVRLRLSMPLAALRALVESAPSVHHAAAPAVAALRLKVEAALAEALGAALAAETALPAQRTAAVSVAATGDDVASAGSASLPGGAVLRLLRDWCARGVLQDRLAAFSLDALAAWHSDILAAAPAATSGASHVAAGAAAAVTQRLLAAAPSPTSPAAALRLRLFAFAECEAAAGGSVGDAAVRAIIDRLVPPPAQTGAPQEAPSSDGAAADKPATNARAAASAAAGRRPPPPAEPRAPPAPQSIATPTELVAETALPFLILGPLARLGWLDTLRAVIGAARLDAAAAAMLATALAYKVLPPPARGWLRTPRSRTTAAAAGLLSEAPEDGALAALAARIAPQLSPLDAVIAGALLEGHRPGTPLLLTPGAKRLLLSDVDGAFPIAIAADVDALLPVLRRTPQEIMLVAADAADPGLLAALDRAGIRFVTDAPPGRGATLRALTRRPRERWWTNDRQAPATALVTAARRLGAATALGVECWRELGVERPTIPRLGDHPLDDTLTLAAATALGSIAWELWRAREATAPQSALARFHDFEARLHVDATNVQVRLPLGRRFFELLEHGLLRDVANVPWLGGRVLRFGSG
jgi:hypothetical protein